jgi:hypothetical protein
LSGKEVWYAEHLQNGFRSVSLKYFLVGFPQQQQQQEQREQSLWNSGYMEILWTSSKRMSLGSAFKVESSLALDLDGLPFHRRY